jgi:hypothetical protein
LLVLTVTFEVAVPPGATVAGDAAEAERVNVLLTEEPTVRVTVVVCVIDPEVPVTVTT